MRTSIIAVVRTCGLLTWILSSLSDGILDARDGTCQDILWMSKRHVVFLVPEGRLSFVRSLLKASPSAWIVFPPYSMSPPAGSGRKRKRIKSVHEAICQEEPFPATIKYYSKLCLSLCLMPAVVRDGRMLCRRISVDYL